MVHGPDTSGPLAPWPSFALDRGPFYPIKSYIERATKMAKVAAYHSAKAGTKVHHNNNQCTEGNNIESYNRRSGTGGLPLCSHCQRL